MMAVKSLLSIQVSSNCVPDKIYFGIFAYETQRDESCEVCAT
jgi:hypothetical protein